MCRRYHELLKNLPRTLELAEAELGLRPDVVLVWARPEVCRLWLMKKLLADGLVTHLLTRQAVDTEGDDRPTTLPESLNLRLGLDFVRGHYGANHYAVAMAADVSLREGTLGMVHSRFAEGQKAFLFHWENGCAREGVWHTNCFAVCLDEAYWPPVSPPADPDVLERQWGRRLEALSPPGVFRWHNYAGKRFGHDHESESLPEVPRLPQPGSGSAPLWVRGSESLSRRLWRGVSESAGRLVRTIRRLLWRPLP